MVENTTESAPQPHSRNGGNSFRVGPQHNGGNGGNNFSVGTHNPMVEMMEIMELTSVLAFNNMVEMVEMTWAIVSNPFVELMEIVELTSEFAPSLLWIWWNHFRVDIQSLGKNGGNGVNTIASVTWDLLLLNILYDNKSNVPL